MSTKLSKRAKREIKDAIAETERQITELYRTPLGVAKLTRLDVISLMLKRISTRLEEKHGKRGSERGV